MPVIPNSKRIRQLLSKIDNPTLNLLFKEVNLSQESQQRVRLQDRHRQRFCYFIKEPDAYLDHIDELDLHAAAGDDLDAFCTYFLRKISINIHKVQ